MKRIFYPLALLLLFSGCSSDEGYIKIYNENPWYWEYRGEPVLLLGGSYEDNMFQFPNDYYHNNDPHMSKGMTDMNLEEHLDKLVEVGGNYLRASLSCRNPGNRFPYKKIFGEPGINTNTDIYDLDQWDEVWEERLKTFLNMCHDRGIIVSIEFFDRFDLFAGEHTHQDKMRRGSHNTGWEEHPWNPDRNINYTQATSGLPGGIIHNMGYDHELWYCVPGLSEHSKAPGAIVLETLQKYIDKVLSYTFQYNNVLYIIENETYQPLEFGSYWVDYITNKADEAGKVVYVTNMEGQHDVNHDRQKSIRRPAKYKFYDHSQNNHKTGQEHYDNILIARADIEDSETETGIKPINNVKIYGSDTYGSVQDAKERWWRGIFAGLAAVRFHRPNYIEYVHGLGLGEIAQTQIRSARMLADEMNIFRCIPDNRFLSDRRINEAYCLAEAGYQYAVYFTDGGSVNLDMSGASGSFIIKWLNIEESQWGPDATIPGGGSQTLTPPSSGQWVVLISRH